MILCGVEPIDDILICRGILARECGVVGPKVGKYSVHITEIDKITLPSLKVDQSSAKADNQKTFIIIDEIGTSEEENCSISDYIKVS